MASTFTLGCSLSTPIRASSGSSRKPDPNRRKSVSSTWWAPLFGWSSDADYINTSSTTTGGTNLDGSDKESGMLGSEQQPGRPRSRFALGCFTEEKAKQLRRNTMESSSFHDIMYHSAIASRLASDGLGRPER